MSESEELNNTGSGTLISRITVDDSCWNSMFDIYDWLRREKVPEIIIVNDLYHFSLVHSEKTRYCLQYLSDMSKEFGFSFEALKEHSKDLFGVKPEILEGALFYIKHQPITKTEAKKHIDAFLSKEV